MTRAQVLRLIGLIRAGWPRDEMSPETAKAYAEDLLDLDHDTALEAFAELRRTRKFRPHQSELRERVAEKTLAIPSASAAWAEVEEAAKDYDDYDEARKWPTYSHDLIRQTVRALGGLRALTYSSNPSTDRAHFLRLYREMRQEVVETAMCGDLPALSTPQRKALPGGEVTT